MRNILIILSCAVLLSCSLTRAASPIQFGYTKVDLYTLGHSIHASLMEDENRLKYFRIEKEQGTIELGEDIMSKITNPDLGSITSGSMPYLVEGQYKYFSEVSLTFYGEETCKSEDSSRIWAPPSQLKIISWGLEFTTRIDIEECKS